MYTLLYCIDCHKDKGISTMATAPAGTLVIQQEHPPVKCYMPHIIVAVLASIFNPSSCGIVALMFAGKSYQFYAISLALNVIRRCRDTDFIIFSDSMSSLQALSGFKLEIDLVQKILKDYTTLTNSGKSIVLCWIPSHVNIYSVG